jgi:glycerol 3-phosphate ABC transporter membrane protein
MIENRRGLDIFSHTLLVLGVLTILFPLYVAIVAATLDNEAVYQVPMTLVPGTHLWDNISRIWTQGVNGSGPAFGMMMLNSLIMALGITVGKIAVSMLSAFCAGVVPFPVALAVLLADLHHPDAAGRSAYLSDGRSDFKPAHARQLQWLNPAAHGFSNCDLPVPPVLYVVAG